MRRINWTQVLVFGLVVLVVFVIGLSLLPILFGGNWRGTRYDGRLVSLV